MDKIISKVELKEKLTKILDADFSVTPNKASDAQLYKALSTIIVSILKDKRQRFINKAHSNGKKQIYYLSMEFLMGRSLKTSIYNLGLVDVVTDVLKNDFKANIDHIYEYEPDAGLGNGGLGRLAACYLDGLATQGYPAMGYSICYEYGIFKQKIEDGWQTELPDNWLPGGNVWLDSKPDMAIDVHFDGELHEYWDNQYHHINHVNYNTVTAIPHDLYVSGYNSEAVSVLRLWSAKAPSFNMEMFNKGDYDKALGQNSTANAISKILYPNDNHMQGKALRLRQQYFMCAASIGDIVNNHMSVYGTLDNFHEKVAIHINDTHPTLAIPELMRILLDDCGYSWEKAWHIVTNTFAYTNHTVMAEALEKWDMNLVKEIIPRIFTIIIEINNRYCKDLMERNGYDSAKTTRMSIVKDNQIHMATLCIVGSHSVNGVSKLHSEIIKESVFNEEYQDTPTKFKNVTNGIAYRRWLYQSNPGLTKLLQSKIGNSFLDSGANLSKFLEYQDDPEVLEEIKKIKKENKERFAKYVKNHSNGLILNTDSIFDVQVKRLHEYKRQHLNALNIIADYNYLLQNPNADFTPKTYIFGSKAAPGYYLAKQIIKMIWAISEEIRKNPRISEKLAVYFLEDYKVTLSELLMPAADISEQISLAGTEASGTGNMKLMLNGAITLGTMDGANVEIYDAVGKDNIIIFGMTTPEVNALKPHYRPEDFFNSNKVIQDAINRMYRGINGCTFSEVADSLKKKDPYMVLADFNSYREAQQLSSKLYNDSNKWAKMSLINTASSGIFSADRSVDDYARDIWHLTK